MLRIITSLLAIIVLIQCSQNKPNESEYQELFDGSTLNGWEGDTTYWRVEEGCIVGEVTPETLLKRNSFIVWKAGVTENFELFIDYKISDKGNSGVNYRSTTVPEVPFALRGYQADIDGRKVHTGQNYEERARKILARRGESVLLPPVDGTVDDFAIKNVWTAAVLTKSIGGKDSLKTYINDDWNTLRIVADGNHLSHYINDVLMCEVVDEDEANRTASGLLGMQVHVGPPMKVAFKNIRYKVL